MSVSYDPIQKELNIEQEVFDEIISDQGAKQKICEALYYCLENAPELKELASLILQYIADVRMDSAYDEWLEDHMEEFKDEKQEVEFKKFLDSAGIDDDISSVDVTFRTWRMMKDIYENSDRNDGGPGSGNFNHEGRPGEVGGSAPSPYGKLSDAGKAIIADHMENPMHFGLSDEQKAENGKKLAAELKKIGVKVTYNEEDDWHPYQASCPEMTYQENQNINLALNQSIFNNDYSREDYIKDCEEAGVKPRLSEQPREVPEWALYSKGGKKQSDGTPVYASLDKEKLLSDSDILEYAGYDEDLDASAHSKTENAASSAIESMTDAQRAAINGYTRQYGNATYRDVNRCLVTGEGSDEAKKAAGLITGALDHEIGAKCICSRGSNSIHGTDNDEKVAKLVSQIQRGDFSKAGQLKELLEGKTIENKAAMSTSPGDSTSKYGTLPVQFIFKTPADAKAVNISDLSAYNGGRSEIEKKLGATGFFGAMETEHEVLFKPGVKYEIERVEMRADNSGKKRTGQVYIVARIMSENNDGGPGSGNFGHEGRPGKVGGSAPADGTSKGSENSKKKTKKVAEPQQITKRRANGTIRDILSDELSREEKVSKVKEVLDELHGGSKVKMPDTWNDDEGKPTIIIKDPDDEDHWLQVIEGQKYGFGSTKELAEYFVAEYEDFNGNLCEVTQSSFSKAEKDAQNEKWDQEHNWRRNSQVWHDSGSFTEQTEIKMTKFDLENCGYGFEVVGSDGKTYINDRDIGWVEKETYRKADMRHLENPSYKGDFFDINFGMNGVSKEECDRARDVYGNMPKDLRSFYEERFRNAACRVELRTDKPSHCDEFGNVWIRPDSNARTVYHEYGHSIDGRSKLSSYPSMDMEKVAGSPHQEKEDFEAMASIIGFKTDGKGHFSGEHALSAEGSHDKRCDLYWSWAKQQEKNIPGFENVSDAISALTKESCGEVLYGGHDKPGYWYSVSNLTYAGTRYSEYWAEYCQMKAFGQEEALSLLKKITPNLYNATEKIYEEAMRHA